MSERLRLCVGGAVQGVGFRPFVYRLAQGMGLAGWVENSPGGVTIEVEGAAARLRDFASRLRVESPPRAAILDLKAQPLAPQGETGFSIRRSQEAGVRSALVLPDLATCGACRAEIFDPRNRRYLYPFTNCTDCGPRYSIVLDLPYDRGRTTMARFAMCGRCRAEYEGPASRRFHAEPNACPECGPQLSLLDAAGRTQSEREAALWDAARALREGRIVAVKGIGGFHLMADARNDGVVAELRRRKRRLSKPMAVMVASVDQARQLARLSPLEQALLASPEAPIVLVRRRGSDLAASLTPGNPDLGLLLAYTPLHHLLLAALGFPLVATSGNLSEEPICIDATEARERLCGVADRFLVHDRPIARHADDSLVRVVAGREMLLRRARGYAPLPLPLGESLPAILAVGGHQKNCVALAVGDRAFVSPHVGDLESPAALLALGRSVDFLEKVYRLEPQALACDLHPDYASSRYAHASGRPIVEVQHHYAHILACMAEHDLSGSVLGIAWDGSGLGTDGTIWGGEALRILPAGFERVAYLHPFRLPGGERAVREPRRSALGLLHELPGGPAPELARLFSQAERRVLDRLLESGRHSPLTSSAGRLFDGVAALVGLHPVADFEGQAAMALEFALPAEGGEDHYDFSLAPRVATDGWVLDWRPMMEQVLAQIRAGTSAGSLSLRFHNTLAEMIVAVARRVGEERVVLSGGCFQNRYLTERAVARLRHAGFEPYWHRRLPPNDGGLAVGQIVGAARALRGR